MVALDGVSLQIESAFLNPANVANAQVVKSGTVCALKEVDK